MSKAKNTSSLFDEDFEVTYEEEVPFTYTFDSKPIKKQVIDETVVMNSAPVMDKDYDDNDEYDSDSYDDYEQEPRIKRRDLMPPSRGILRSKRAPKYGTKHIYRTARTVVRVVSLLITAGTFSLLGYTFWKGAAPYGDPQTILTEQNHTLIAYAAIASVFLIYEFFSFLWSTTKVKIRDGRTVYREDTGRGLGSFICIYISSYLSFLLCSFLPETLGDYKILNGIKGALDVFGSLHNVLFGLCLAGVISCLVRRHMI